MTILHLTPAERAALKASFPASRLTAYSFADEVLTFEDSEAQAKLRLRTMRPRNESLQDYISQVKKAQTAQQAIGLLDAVHTDELTTNELIDVLFAVGPAQISRIIAVSIPLSRTESDLEDIASLALARHCLLQALQPSA